MTKMKLMLATLVLAGAVVQTGCSGTITISQAWYDVYGYRCGSGNPAPGCNFYSDGSKIRDWEDPYFNSYYNLEYGFYDYYDSYGYYSTYLGYAWLSPTGILYDDYGYALNTKDGKNPNQKKSGGRDLDGSVAKAENELTKDAALRFAEKYAKEGDSVETRQALVSTGMRVAKTLREFDNVAKTRNRSMADVQKYAEKLFGVKADRIAKALASAEKGDLSGLIAANEDVAKSWGLSPSRSKEILKTWFRDQAKQVGVE